MLLKLNEMMMYLFFFFYLAVNFILLINKPTFSHHGVSRESYFHLPWFNLDTFDLEQHSVSTITFEQDATMLAGLQGSGSFGVGQETTFLKET